MKNYEGKRVYIRYDGFIFDSFAQIIDDIERRKSLMLERYGIEYRTFEIHDIVVDNERFLLFLLEHGEHIIDISD